jgi:hypothetical protein
MTTPDFPFWAGGFASQLHRLRTTTGPILHQFEALFSPWIARYRLAQQEEGSHSRDRCWNLRLVFWTFLWQVAQAGASCREAIRQAQSLCRLRGQAIPPDENSPYCQSRGHIPLECLQEIHDDLAREAQRVVAQKDRWCGHRVCVVDASTVTLEDTPENQQAFPQQSVQAKGCGFPILRVAALFELATGMISSWVTGTWRTHEIVLFQQLWEHLRPGDVLLGDRGFSGWAVLAQCVARAIHGVFRVHGARKIDFRKGQRLSRDERLVRWPKPRLCPRYLTAQPWAQLPDVLELRLVRCRINVPGFRTRQVILVTTLLDRAQYTAAALGGLYLRRWDMELTLRHLKTTLQMEHLSCKNPHNVERELRMHLLVHNLVRRLMLESARRTGVALSRISFAGALAVARRYGEAMLQARSQRQRTELMDDLYRVLAADLVPDRPGRREPRAVKRRPKPFPRLMCHRSKFKEIPHQNRYWAGSPCRKKSRS